MITRGEFDSFLTKLREESPDVNAIAISPEAARHIGFGPSLLWDYTSQKFIFIHGHYVVDCEAEVDENHILALVCSR